MGIHKECVAVLIGLYKKNDAVAHVIMDFPFISRNQVLHLYDLVMLLYSESRFSCQSVETATHSSVLEELSFQSKISVRVSV